MLAASAFWSADEGALPPRTATRPPGGSATSSSDPQPSSEYTTLQAWRSAITEGDLASWVGPNVCAYKGVFCSTLPPAEYHYSLPPSPAGHVVYSIDLNKANLWGTLVRELALLCHLSILHLNGIQFTGTVPDEFRDIASLTELELSNNRFSGLFPVAAVDMPILIYLDLRFNGFSPGASPRSCSLRGLGAIFLNNNYFEGQIPMTSPAPATETTGSWVTSPAAALQDLCWLLTWGLGGSEDPHGTYGWSCYLQGMSD